jgi:hypothetical protein
MNSAEQGKGADLHAEAAANGGGGGKITVNSSS